MVDEKVIWCLREALLKQSAGDDSSLEVIRTLTDTELLASYLLGLPTDGRVAENLLNQEGRVETLIGLLSEFGLVPTTEDPDTNIGFRVLHVTESDPVFVLAKGVVKAYTSDKNAALSLEKLSFLKTLF